MKKKYFIRFLAVSILVSSLVISVLYIQRRQLLLVSAKVGLSCKKVSDCGKKTKWECVKGNLDKKGTCQKIGTKTARGKRVCSNDTNTAKACRGKKVGYDAGPCVCQYTDSNNPNKFCKCVDTSGSSCKSLCEENGDVWISGTYGAGLPGCDEYDGGSYLYATTKKGDPFEKCIYGPSSPDYGQTGSFCCKK